MKATLRASLLVAGVGWALAAHAQLWGYVDGAGVAHVASSQLDSRYRLVMGERKLEENRVSGKSDGAGGLITWLDFAPEVKRLTAVLREAAKQEGVDIELLKAVIAVESGFNDRAVSPRGAIGLMQLTPETADRYATTSEAKRPAAERLLDPRINVLTGARMLADLLRRFGSIDVALAAWNAGEGTVRKHGGKVPPIPETQAHVHLVLELYWALLQNNLPRGARQLQVQPEPALRTTTP